MATQTYDPTNVAPYFGKQFRTSNSIYEIDKNGNFKGRKSLDGAKVIGIASLAQRDKFLLSPLLDSKDSSVLLDALREHGFQPTSGMSLAVVISQEDAHERSKVGIMTSPLESID